MARPRTLCVRLPQPGIPEQAQTPRPAPPLAPSNAMVIPDSTPVPTPEPARTELVQESNLVASSVFGGPTQESVPENPNPPPPVQNTQPPAIKSAESSPAGGPKPTSEPAAPQTSESPKPPPVQSTPIIVKPSGPIPINPTTISKSVVRATGSIGQPPKVPPASPHPPTHQPSPTSKPANSQTIKRPNQASPTVLSSPTSANLATVTPTQGSIEQLKKQSLNFALILGPATGAFVVLGLLAMGLHILFRKRRRTKSKPRPRIFGPWSTKEPGYRSTPSSNTSSIDAKDKELELLRPPMRSKSPPAWQIGSPKLFPPVDYSSFMPKLNQSASQEQHVEAPAGYVPGTRFVNDGRGNSSTQLPHKPVQLVGLPTTPTKAAFPRALSPDMHVPPLRILTPQAQAHGGLPTSPPAAAMRLSPYRTRAQMSASPQYTFFPPVAKSSTLPPSQSPALRPGVLRAATANPAFDRPGTIKRQAAPAPIDTSRPSPSRRQHLGTDGTDTSEALGDAVNPVFSSRYISERRNGSRRSRILFFGPPSTTDASTTFDESDEDRETPKTMTAKDTVDSRENAGYPRPMTQGPPRAPPENGRRGILGMRSKRG